MEAFPPFLRMRTKGGKTYSGVAQETLAGRLPARSDERATEMRLVPVRYRNRVGNLERKMFDLHD